MKFKLLDSVILMHDLPDHGLRAGLLGAVVHVHEPNWLEVEFFDAPGETVAVIPVHDADLRTAEQNDLTTFRGIRRTA